MTNLERGGLEKLGYFGVLSRIEQKTMKEAERGKERRGGKEEERREEGTGGLKGFELGIIPFTLRQIIYSGFLQP